MTAKHVPAGTTDKRAILGHPSQIWTPGLERRLDLVRRYVDLEDRRILDIGCGVGAFVPLACHDPDRRDATLRSAETMAALLEDIGADNFVTALVSDPDDWARPEVSEAGWSHLFAMLEPALTAAIDELPAQDGM